MLIVHLDSEPRKSSHESQATSPLTFKLQLRDQRTCPGSLAYFLLGPAIQNIPTDLDSMKSGFYLRTLYSQTLHRQRAMLQISGDQYEKNARVFAAPFSRLLLVFSAKMSLKHTAKA